MRQNVWKVGTESAQAMRSRKIEKSRNQTIKSSNRDLEKINGACSIYIIHHVNA
jgi:hypothetical protein